MLAQVSLSSSLTSSWSLSSSSLSVKYALSTTTYNDFTARSGGTATLYNNAVYFIGGYNNGNGNWYTGILKYDISTNVWTNVLSYHVNLKIRFQHATVLYNDALYIISGATGVGEWDSGVYKYTIATNTLTSLAPSGTFTGGWGHTATLYNDDIYIIGGINMGTRQRNGVVKYSISSNTYSSVTTSGITLPSTEGHTATLYNDEIYVIGGLNDQDYVKNSVSKFNIATSVWTTVTTSGVTFPGRWGHGAYLFNGAIYILGGSYLTTGYYGDFRSDIYMLDIATSKWRSITPTGTWVGRTWFGSVSYNNVMYVFGGESTSVGVRNDVVTLTYIPQGIIVIISSSSSHDGYYYSYSYSYHTQLLSSSHNNYHYHYYYYHYHYYYYHKYQQYHQHQHQHNHQRQHHIL